MQRRWSGDGSSLELDGCRPGSGGKHPHCARLRPPCWFATRNRPLAQTPAPGTDVPSEAGAGQPLRDRIASGLGAGCARCCTNSPERPHGAALPRLASGGGLRMDTRAACPVLGPFSSSSPSLSPFLSPSPAPFPRPLGHCRMVPSSTHFAACRRGAAAPS